MPKTITITPRLPSEIVQLLYRRAHATQRAVGPLARDLLEQALHGDAEIHLRSYHVSLKTREVERIVKTLTDVRRHSTSLDGSTIGGKGTLLLKRSTFITNLDRAISSLEGVYRETCRLFGAQQSNLKQLQQKANAGVEISLSNECPTHHADEKLIPARLLVALGAVPDPHFKKKQPRRKTSV